jgi:hypothetical protein
MARFSAPTEAECPPVVVVPGFAVALDDVVGAGLFALGEVEQPAMTRDAVRRITRAEKRRSRRTLPLSRVAHDPFSSRPRSGRGAGRTIGPRLWGATASSAVRWASRVELPSQHRRSPVGVSNKRSERPHLARHTSPDSWVRPDRGFGVGHPPRRTSRSCLTAATVERPVPHDGGAGRRNSSSG